MKLLTNLLPLFFPMPCAVCAEPLQSLRFRPCCKTCWDEADLFPDNGNLCRKCGKPNSRSLAPNETTFCRECDDDFFDFARACGLYKPPLSNSVIELKTIPKVSDELGNLLFEVYTGSGFVPADTIIPMPLSKRRLFERGFNQAEIIADAFAVRANISVDRKSLAREKHTEKSRAAMDKKGRQISVLNAFRVKRRSLVENTNVLLIDDVLTTGASASMAAKTLKKCGAKRVEVLTIARAGK